MNKKTPEQFLKEVAKNIQNQILADDNKESCKALINTINEYIDDLSDSDFDSPSIFVYVFNRKTMEFDYLESIDDIINWNSIARKNNLTLTKEKGEFRIYANKIKPSQLEMLNFFQENLPMMIEKQRNVIKNSQGFLNDCKNNISSLEKEVEIWENKSKTFSEHQKQTENEKFNEYHKDYIYLLTMFRCTNRYLGSRNHEKLSKKHNLDNYETSQNVREVFDKICKRMYKECMEETGRSLY